MVSLPPYEWLESMIRIDSITDRSNDEVVRFLLPKLEAAGLTVRVHRVKEKGVSFANLIALSSKTATRGLLALNTHLDTVPFGDRNDWTATGNDPFRLTRDGDKLYGLGSADVKLDFLCKIWAATHAKRDGRPFALVGTYGEERGLVGARKLLEAEKLKPKFALVGEPSALQLIYAHKGHLMVTFRVRLGGKGETLSWKGLSAHSSTPHLGDNAIRKALSDVVGHGWGMASLHAGVALNVVPDLARAEVLPRPNAGVQTLARAMAFLDGVAAELAKKKDKRFDPAIATLSVNTARMIGNDCELLFDIRLLPDTEATKLKRTLTKGLEKAGAKKIVIEHDPALVGKKSTKFLRAAAGALKSAGVDPVVNTKATSTEAGVYSEFGAEAAIFGPGISVGNVHRPNEYNFLSHLEAATRFYRAVLELPVSSF